MLADTNNIVPCHRLEGMDLDNGWKVTSKITKTPLSTGGFFSVSYEVINNDGRVGFLKALDYSTALNSPDPTTALKPLVDSTLFEREMLELCRGRNFDHIVRIVEFGRVRVGPIFSEVVEYLIFEKAESDIRSHINSNTQIDLAWRLRMLHNAAVGVSQLHSIGIAHQDIKPSNILQFDQGKISKLADLGRAVHPDRNPPHNENIFPGDRNYSPPEVWFGYAPPDFQQRRFGSDAFMLGNIILFAFTNITMTAILWRKFNELAVHEKFSLDVGYHAITPYLQRALNEVIIEITPDIPQKVRSEIIMILRELCEPDIDRRGRATGRSNFNMQRYITKLDRLAYMAKRNLF